jgi:PASTA domain-containing protein
MAAVAAAAFACITATAQAGPMAAGTWDGKITGGTLTLGNGKYHDIAVPGGDAFTFTIPAGASSPAGFTAPAIHVELPLQTDVDGLGTQRTAGGSLDISPIAGTVDPATGVAHGTASARGVLHLTTFNPSSPPGFSQYCYLGGLPAPPDDPKPLLPFALDLTGAGALHGDFTANLDCGSLIPLGTTGLPNIGDTVMASALTLSVAFTRHPDPQPIQNTPPQTVAPVQCVVPKLTGLRLAKARTAAKKAHCAVGKVKRKKSARKATTVLKQGTKAGAVRARGSKIALTVAK